MYQRRRIGELLSFIHNTGIVIQYDTMTLLRAKFKANDYYDFLKQEYRFKVYCGIKKEIVASIEKLIEKRQVADAEGWRRKFEVLHEHDARAGS